MTDKTQNIQKADELAILVMTALDIPLEAKDEDRMSLIMSKVTPDNIQDLAEQGIHKILAEYVKDKDVDVKDKAFTHAACVIGISYLMSQTKKG